MSEAAFDELRKLRLISGTKAVHKLGKGPAIITHLERAFVQRLRDAAWTKALNSHFKWLLIESADLDLTPLAEDERFHSIAGDVIAADLDLSGKIVVTRRAPIPP